MRIVLRDEGSPLRRGRRFSVVLRLISVTIFGFWGWNATASKSWWAIGGGGDLLYLSANTMNEAAVAALAVDICDDENGRSRPLKDITIC